MMQLSTLEDWRLDCVTVTYEMTDNYVTFLVITTLLHHLLVYPAGKMAEILFHLAGNLKKIIFKHVR